MDRKIESESFLLAMAGETSPIIHILIPGKQLCQQAKAYINLWLINGAIEEPCLGSLIPHLLLNNYIHSHNILVTLIEPNTSLPDINVACKNMQLSDKFFSEKYSSNINSVFLICSHQLLK